MPQSMLLIEAIIEYKNGRMVNIVNYVVKYFYWMKIWFVGAAVGVTVAGDPAGSSGPYAYQLSSPTAIQLDQYGYIYILDTANSRVQKWYPGATYGLTVVAATMNSPYGLSFDLFGNLFIADTIYQRILSFAVYCRKWL